MAQTLSISTSQKQNLNLSLKLWLPMLQTSIQDLESYLTNLSYENPFLEVKKPKEFYNNFTSNGTSGEFIESLAFYAKSLNDKLSEQIEDDTLFPTPNSKKVALEILCDIDENGYFDGDIEKIAITCNVYKEYVESIRQRFSRLEPSGVGALNLEESFLFQLDSIDRSIDDELYNFTKKIIKDITHIDKYAAHHRFNDAKDIIKYFNNPPAIDYINDNVQVIPDFFVEINEDIEIKINNSYYPDIKVKNPFNTKNENIKEKLKEAKDLVNLLNLRKATLYKIVLIIVEKQISFFVGGELKPFSMQEIAAELGFAESTISRAVSNKYIECNLGIFPLKYFFTNAVDKDLSSSQIKSYIKSLVDYENKDEPLTDEAILEYIEEKFSLKMVRRTITKYRKILDIPSSKERKKLYKVENL
ncbi:MAG: RNA polymerase factor sigma-54 [Arcobacter sp.]|jgi:RNA polymerase sigma-54 factor|uniref:RNA polymerase sigma54 factor n=1 Tax=Arcobacter defluvii TaxID=873191 RepID=A0AAE7BDP3_9BACT|nr:MULTISPECIES: RNA polymerase factor sigma-54 [Arcobacter]MDY3201514.1 RNA polymerase factor sigma-54 [Arcobacter sp.]QKF76122.1 RNA polymerase sigma54 factor [Arcobacter defluvii]RXI32278.1 RNA polymerase sigma-54 factor [Arcobacter defluvii]BAK71913.1 RNA polymerase factor sigma-54 [Arcobacter sp. L]